jgi:hypothetical protein
MSWADGAEMGRPTPKAILSRSILFLLLLAEVERTQLLRMIPDVGKNALAFLNASRSASIRRAEIRSYSRNALEDARPPGFDRRHAHE